MALRATKWDENDESRLWGGQYCSPSKATGSVGGFSTVPHELRYFAGFPALSATLRAR